MVGDITSNYIKEADAIIFVKPLTGQAAESSSFRKFLDSNTVGRSKAALLLALTRKSDLGEKEVFTLKEQAADMYGKHLDNNRIAAIDSKLQLFYHRCKNKSETEISNLFKEDVFSAAELCWLKADKIRSEFLNLLEKKSNFDQISGMLERFATKAHYIQLRDFLDMISGGYETIQKKLEEKFDLLQKSTEYPVKLKREVELKREEIEEIKLRINEGIERIRNEYTKHEGGIIGLEAEKAFEKFKSDFENSTQFDDIEKKHLMVKMLFSISRKNSTLKLSRTVIASLLKSPTKHIFILPLLSKAD
ncbi:MAG: hypothetical protein LBG96_07130 [Tannerella sp.]|jgi:hypothetical protein|nr:hypothetical protein [Tannerella sp.]